MKKRKKITIFGGGTGITPLERGLVLLGGAERFLINVIVTVFDSGGSSGILRDELGVLAPGDFLKSLVALSSKPDAARMILHHRFRGLSTGKLDNHTAGNMLLTMLAQFAGNYIAAARAMEQMLDCQGRVWPVSTEGVTLVAETNRRSIRGEGKIEDWLYKRKGVKTKERLLKVFLEPKPRLLPQASKVIEGADVVVIGPGSINTSLLACLDVHGIPKALAGKFVVYVVNLTTHPKETAGWKASNFVSVVERQIRRKVDVVVCNSKIDPHLLHSYKEEGSEPVVVDIHGDWDGRRVITRRLVSPNATLARHDPIRLAKVITQLE